MSLSVQACSECGILSFPIRLACEHCGSPHFATVAIESGVVEECVQVINPEPAVLSQLRLSPELIVIAAVQGAFPQRGERLPIKVALEPSETTYAYVPQAPSSEDLTKGI